MRRFLSTWLALIVVAVFALSMLLCSLVFTRSAEQTAQADLNALLDAAFVQFNAVGADAEAVSEVSKTNVLAKARAVARFLAHDDALLQTDALVSLCELLAVAAIDVTDYDGVVVASSVVGRIGRNLTAEPASAWTREVLSGEGVERTRVDATDQALLWGCVPRTDTEGFVLVQSLDAAILSAYASTAPELVLNEFSFVNDTLSIAATPGDDAAYLEGDRYCVRRTQTVAGTYGELTLIAARAQGAVYVLRNVVLLVLCIIGLFAVGCALVVQVALLRRRKVRSHIAFDQRPRLPASLSDEDPLDEACAPLEPSDAQDTPSASDPLDAPTAAESLDLLHTDALSDASDVADSSGAPDASDSPEAAKAGSDGTDGTPSRDAPMISPAHALPDRTQKKPSSKRSRHSKKSAADPAAKAEPSAPAPQETPLPAEPAESGFDKIF